MTWSIEDERRGSTSSRRGRICGTFTRAKTRSPVSGSRRPTAIDRLRRRDVRERMARDRPRVASGPGRSRRGSAGGGRRDARGSRRSRRSRCPRRRAPGGRRRRSREWSATSVEDRSRAAASCSAGVRPSGARVTAAGLDLLAQAGDADLEELVEVAREDRQELDPLEQWVPGVARFVQDPRVELQPRQLAVEVREHGAFGSRARGAAACGPGDGGAGGCSGFERRPSRAAQAPRMRRSALAPCGVPAGARIARSARAAPPAADARHVSPRRYAPFAGIRVDPDAHPVGASSGPRSARRSGGSADPSAVGRLAAAGPGRRRGPLRLVRAIADPLDDGADDQRPAPISTAQMPDDASRRRPRTRPGRSA